MAKHSCPECGSTEVIPIAYGMPDHTVFEASERGEVEIGGCVIFLDNPTHLCRGCGNRFGTRSRAGE